MTDAGAWALCGSERPLERVENDDNETGRGAEATPLVPNITRLLSEFDPRGMDGLGAKVVELDETILDSNEFGRMESVPEP